MLKILTFAKTFETCMTRNVVFFLFVGFALYYTNKTYKIAFKVYKNNCHAQDVAY